MASIMSAWSSSNVVSRITGTSALRAVQFGKDTNATLARQPDVEQQHIGIFGSHRAERLAAITSTSATISPVSSRAADSIKPRDRAGKVSVRQNLNGTFGHCATNARAPRSSTPPQDRLPHWRILSRAHCL